MLTLFFYITISVFTVLPAKHNLPLLAIDAGLREVIYLIQRYAIGVSNNETVKDSSWKWDESCINRIDAYRLFFVGVILITMFPLHRYFATDEIISGFYNIIHHVRELAQLISGEEPLRRINFSWQNSEHDLWSVCAFAWIIIQIAYNQFKDIGYLNNKYAANNATAFHFGAAYGITILFLFIIGFWVFFIDQSNIGKIVFEISVLLILGVIELINAITALKNNDDERAQISLLTFVVIELPTLIALSVIAIFIAKAQALFVYQSHWSTPFVSGASALNLMLANIAIVTIRLYFGSRRV